MSACAAEEPINTGSQSEVVSGDATGMDGQVTDGLCTPGAVKECTSDGAFEVVCNPDGDGWTASPCEDADEKPTSCIDGSCTVCTPLTRRCRDDDHADTCVEDGSAWIETANCSASGEGRFCVQGTCVRLCDLNLKQNTNMGCEYWAGDLDNAFVNGDGGVLDAQGAQYAILVSNPDPSRPASVEIHNSEGRVLHDSKGVPFPTGKLLPRSLRIYKMPRRDINGTVHAPLAYRVTTSIPTIAYQFNPLANEEVYSNDASLLIPSQSLDREHYIMTREQSHESIRAYLTVIGTVANTDVSVTVTARTLAGEGIPALEPGESLNRTLAAFDVLNIETDGTGEDLTGSRVVSSRRVAVFGGSEGSNAPNTERCNMASGVCEYDPETPCESHEDCAGFVTCCADHIEQQLFPVKTWSTRYIAARTSPRGNEPELWRIMAARDNTVVNTIPTQASVPVLDAGEWYEFSAMDDFEIVASAPVMVGQFMTSEHAPGPGEQSGDAKTGDPAFLLVPPVEQFRDNYIVLTPPDFDFNFVNVVAPMAAEIVVDGKPVGPLNPVGTGEFGRARIEVGEGVIRLDGDQPFGVTVYGFGQYVSYGYPGGLNLGESVHYKPPTD